MMGQLARNLPHCRTFGLRYLYQGLDAKLLQSVTAAGFMFLTYEQISSAIFFALYKGARAK
jgi:hypothetical protein